MLWLSTHVETLQDDLTPACYRLLSAIIGHLEPTTTGASVIRAPKAPVVEALNAAEPKPPVSAGAIRERVSETNAALRRHAAANGLDAPPFTLKSTKAAFEVRLNADAQETEAARKGVTASIEGTDIDLKWMEEPRYIRRWQVYVSFAPEDEGLNENVARFAAQLNAALGSLPQKYKGLGHISVWLDHSLRDDDSHQAAQAASVSALGIFLLSNRWISWRRRQQDIAEFAKDGAPDPARCIPIRLRDSHLPLPPPFSATHHGDAFETLEELMAPNKAAALAAYIDSLRDQICAKLAALPEDYGNLAPPYEARPPLTLPKSIRQAQFERLQSLGRLDEDKLDDAVLLGKVVPPHGGEAQNTEDAQPILPVLEAWVRDADADVRVTALLGSFGAGKTTTAQLLAKRLAAASADNPLAPLPFYLDFRRLIALYDPAQPEEFSLVRIVAASMDLQSVGDVDVTALLAFMRRRQCVVILDGLDEVGTRIGPEQADKLYRQLLEIVPGDAWRSDADKGAPDWTACPTRLLVTCRTHFFRDHVAQSNTLDAYGRFHATPARPDQQRMRTYYMAPFTPAQIESFLAKTLGIEEGARVQRMIGRVHDLAGLARRPIMTRFIAKLAPQLEADEVAGRPINIATVYGHLFREALERDAYKKTLLRQSVRGRILRDLAFKMWRDRSAQLSSNELEDWFENVADSYAGVRLLLGSSNPPVDRLHTELRNASLLVREEEDAFRFVHTSFQEYFLAAALSDRLIAGALDELADPSPLSDETIEFLFDLAEADQTQSELIRALDAAIRAPGPVSTRQMILRLRSVAARRSVAALVPPGGDLSGLDLRDMRFGGADPGDRFERVNLTGANLLGARFQRLMFDGCNFTDANFAQAQFEDCRTSDCTGDPIGLAAARAIGGPSGENFGLVVGFPFQPTMTAPAVKGALTFNRGRHGWVRSVAFSPDGGAVLTGSDDRTARLWDARTGEERRRFEGYGRAVQGVALSLDGGTVLTGGGDGTARLWDIKTGKEHRRFEGHNRPILCVAVSPEGGAVLTGGFDGVARLWDRETGEERRRFEGHDSVRSVAFSPGGRTVLTGGDDGTARLWDLVTGEERRRFEGHSNWVQSVAFSPDSGVVLTGSFDGTVRLWDSQTGEERICIEDHHGPILSVAVSPIGGSVLTAAFDRTARLWDARTGEEQRRFEGHGSSVRSAAFSLDGKAVLTGGDDGTARLWDAETGKERRRYEGHNGSVNSVAFSPDGGAVLTGGDDGTARLWDAETGEALKIFVGLENAWMNLRSDMTVEQTGPGAWRYVYGLQHQAGAAPVVVAPSYEDLEAVSPFGVV